MRNTIFLHYLRVEKTIFHVLHSKNNKSETGWRRIKGNFWE